MAKNIPGKHYTRESVIEFTLQQMELDILTILETIHDMKTEYDEDDEDGTAGDPRVVELLKQGLEKIHKASEQ